MYKYLLKFDKGTILLFVFEHVVHTFFAINLSKKKDTRAGRALPVYRLDCELEESCFDVREEKEIILQAVPYRLFPKTTQSPIK